MKNKFKRGDRVVVGAVCRGFCGDTGRIIQKVVVSYNETNHPARLRERYFNNLEPVYLVALDNPVKFENEEIESMVPFGQSGLNKISYKNTPKLPL